MKDIALNNYVRRWKVKVSHGIAEVFKEDVSQCKFAMQSGNYPDAISHWLLGSSSDPVDAHVEYTRLYTGALQSGPVGDWRFNETSGTSAGDASGNANTGTVSGAVWAAGKSGNGLSCGYGQQIEFEVRYGFLHCGSVG